MAGIRQIKIIGLTALVFVLVFILHRTGQNAAAMVHAQASDQIGNKHAVHNPAELKKPTTNNNNNNDNVDISNKIIDSANDDKADEEINQKINQEVQSSKQGGSTGAKNDNPAADNGAYDPEKDLIDIRSLSPMTVFSKTFCPYSARLKELLQTYEFTPQFNIVELDKHEHGPELQAYLKEKTGRGTVPNVLVGKTLESRGGSDDFAKFAKDGELINLLVEWGEGRLQVTKKDAPSNA